MRPVIDLLKSKNNATGFLGVSFNSRTKMFHAQIRFLGKQTFLGKFDTAEEAAEMYSGAMQLFFGGQR